MRFVDKLISHLILGLYNFQNVTSFRYRNGGFEISKIMFIINCSQATVMVIVSKIFNNYFEAQLLFQPQSEIVKNFYSRFFIRLGYFSYTMTSISPFFTTFFVIKNQKNILSLLNDCVLLFKQHELSLKSSAFRLFQVKTLVFLLTIIFTNISIKISDLRNHLKPEFLSLVWSSILEWSINTPVWIFSLSIVFLKFISNMLKEISLDDCECEESFVKLKSLVKLINKFNQDTNLAITFSLMFMLLSLSLRVSLNSESVFKTIMYDFSIF